MAGTKKKAGAKKGHKKPKTQQKPSEKKKDENDMSLEEARENWADAMEVFMFAFARITGDSPYAERMRHRFLFLMEKITPGKGFGRAVVDAAINSMMATDASRFTSPEFTQRVDKAIEFTKRDDWCYRSTGRFWADPEGESEEEKAPPANPEFTLEQLEEIYIYCTLYQRSRDNKLVQAAISRPNLMKIIEQKLQKYPIAREEIDAVIDYTEVQVDPENFELGIEATLCRLAGEWGAEHADSFKHAPPTFNIGVLGQYLEMHMKLAKAQQERERKDQQKQSTAPADTAPVEDKTK
jgi:hypothetical protein